MKIGFLGDVHGHVFHALGVVAEWQRRARTRLDLVIQVGDLGAIPDPDASDHPTRRFARVDPAELDFPRMCAATGPLADSLHAMRRQLARPVLFIRGNHDDAVWLRSLAPHADHGTVPVDPFDLFHYVPDGMTLTMDGVRFGFLGGIETRPASPAAIDPIAYARTMAMTPGSLDLLVTHDPPLGAGAGYRQNRQGSALVLALDTHLAPPLHVGGHVHAMLGPKRFGATTYYGCAILVPPARFNPRHAVGRGSFAVWDTVADTFAFVLAPWLSRFDQRFDFARFVARLDGVADGPHTPTVHSSSAHEGEETGG